jgi:hypothetical protein
VIGYGWLLVGAIGMTVLILIAANVGSTGDATGVESDDTNTLGVLIGMPFQLAGMALLGSIHLSEDGFSGSLFLPPLLLTSLYALTTARAARRGDVVPAVGTRALLGVAVGFIAAVVVTPLTWALAMRTDGVSVHAASAGLFFGAWVLTGLASYVGTSGRARAQRPAWLPADYLASARLWVGSVVVWLGVALLVLTIAAAITEDVWVAILSPVWGVTAGLYTYAIAHLGGVTVFGEAARVWDFSAGWAVVMIVGALVLSVLTSIAWHLRRDARETTLVQPQSWLVLPATYAAGGVVLLLASSVVIGGGLADFGGSVTVRPALWTVLVLLVWAAAVEAGSRFLAPSLAPALPPRLHALLRGPERPASSPLSEQPAAPVETRPLTPEERARYKKLGIVAGTFAVLALAAWIAVAVVNSQLYSPEDQAEAYLDAVVEADLEEAQDLAPTEDDMADDGLLTDEIYAAAENRVTGYVLGDVEEDGDSVTIDVELEGPASTTDTTITLVRDGKSAVLFDKWRVTEGGLARFVSITLPEAASEVTVNEVAAGSVDGDVWLLPGDYVIDPFAGNPWVESTGEPVTVAVDESYQFAESSGAVASESFRTEVQRQIDAYLAECMASTELEPENCPNSAYGGSEVRNVKWTLDTPPTPDFDSFDGTFPADLSYGDSGTATVTYELDESYGFGPRDWQPQTEQSELYLSSVVVTEEGDDLVVTISD